MKRFRGGLVFEDHRLLYHSTLGLRVIKKKKVGQYRLGLWSRLLAVKLLERLVDFILARPLVCGLGFRVQGSGFRVE